MVSNRRSWRYVDGVPEQLTRPIFPQKSVATAAYCASIRGAEFRESLKL